MTRKPVALLGAAALAAAFWGPLPPAGAVTLSTLRIGFSRIVSGMDSPTAVAAPNDGTGRLFVTEQPGRIRLVTKAGTLQAGAYLDIRSKVLDGGERGLLGLAFHPSFKTNRYIFASYTDASGALVVSRFRPSSYTATSVSASTETVFLTVAHPVYGNHNGGQLAFGPDGYLYIGTGDGGGGGDPDDNAHDITVLLGKILRIDVNRACGGASYCIPSSNPYASSSTAKREIWEFGLRNPWRFSFDRSGGSLWVADVGQGEIEEISRVGAGVGGKNFGWDCWEGTRKFSGASYCTSLASTVQPIAQYGRSAGDCAVIGGFVYRGSRYAANMAGVYLFGDYCTGFVRAYLRGSVRQVHDHFGSLTSFGEDPAGELYAVDIEGGLYRVTATGGVTPAVSPRPKPTAAATSASPKASPSPSPSSPSPAPSPITPSPLPTISVQAAPPEAGGGAGRVWPWLVLGSAVVGAGFAAALRLRRRAR